MKAAGHTTFGDRRTGQIADFSDRAQAA